MKPTLLVLAAGIGSRYGGLKQIDKLGPGGQTIIEYSIYDAIRAGFGKVVFVIRKDIETDFKNIIGAKIEGKIPVSYLFQEKDVLPEGFTVPADRVKPWGTAHAIMVASNVVNEPFAVINADDFYGYEAYKTIAGYLSSLLPADNKNYCMVGYPVVNTLSEFGTVSRGVCEVNQHQNLIKVTERTKIGYLNNKIVYHSDNDEIIELNPDTPVSMNLWGFSPSVFQHLWAKFDAFLHGNIQNPKAEYLIPSVVDELINEKQAEVKVLTSNAKWFGVTYKEDRPFVVEKIENLTNSGVYPVQF